MDTDTVTNYTEDNIRYAAPHTQATADACDKTHTNEAHKHRLAPSR